jgi:hypothetical protein
MTYKYCKTLNCHEKSESNWLIGLEDSLAFKFWALQNEKRWDFGIKLNSTRNILVRSSAREFVGGNLIYGFASLIDVSESIFL